MQTRDAVHILTLPQLVYKKLCPRSALKALQLLYPSDSHSPLFQWQGSGWWEPPIDSKVRKTLKRFNMALGMNHSHFTSPSFHRSGDTLAFNSHVPVHSNIHTKGLACFKITTLKRLPSEGTPHTILKHAAFNQLAGFYMNKVIHPV